MRTIPLHKKEMLVSAFRSGASIREASRAAGVAKGTASRIRSFMNDVVKCGCGKDSGHRGWCSVRVAKSPPRSAFLANWSRRYFEQQEIGDQKVKTAQHAAKERSTTKKEYEEWRKARKEMQKVVEYLARLNQ